MIICYDIITRNSALEHIQHTPWAACSNLSEFPNWCNKKHTHTWANSNYLACQRYSNSNFISIGAPLLRTIWCWFTAYLNEFANYTLKTHIFHKCKVCFVHIHSTVSAALYMLLLYPVVHLINGMKLKCFDTLECVLFYHFEHVRS